MNSADLSNLLYLLHEALLKEDRGRAVSITLFNQAARIALEEADGFAKPGGSAVRIRQLLEPGVLDRLTVADRRTLASRARRLLDEVTQP